MNCKYCNIDYDPIHGDRTSIPTPDPNLNLYVNDCGEYGGTINLYYNNGVVNIEVEDIVINFCPMCGKELVRKNYLTKNQNILENLLTKF